MKTIDDVMPLGSFKFDCDTNLYVKLSKTQFTLVSDLANCYVKRLKPHVYSITLAIKSLPVTVID